ncbi:MAG: PQQ-like beta-propeller repeat protein, partial [Chloroflexi bacterium]|nr:PQQ-like beta-propeller repeat protein [Chloroflexota bacterium]
MTDDIVRAAPAIGHDGAILFGSNDGFFYALDLATGRLKWKYEAKEMIRSSPAVVGDLVIFGDDIGLLHALDITSGVRKWVFEAGDQIISSVNHDDGRIVFGSY